MVSMTTFIIYFLKIFVNKTDIYRTEGNDLNKRSVQYCSLYKNVII